MPNLSRRRSRLLSSAIATAIVATAVPGTAQEDPREEAAKLYKEGVEAYFAADYGVAITKFRDGFELDPNAMFQYNLSLCFSKLGNPEEALEHAMRAAEMGGMPQEAQTKNDARLAAFRASITSNDIAEELAEPETPEVPTCATNADCTEGEVCNIRRGVCIAELPDGPEEPTEPLFSPYGWAGLGGAVVGAGLLVGAGIVSLNLKSITEEQENATGDRLAELKEQERNHKTTGVIFLFGGGALFAAGATLVVLDLIDVLPPGGSVEADPAGTAHVTPMFGPDYAGFTWSLRF